MEHALPQRPRLGRRELAGGGRGRSAAGRVHDQRHRRASGQYLDGRGGDGAEDASGLLRRRDARSSREQIYPTSRLLSRTIGVPVAPTKPIVGDNAFAHEAGIHQDGVLKNALTYEIMRPESVGRVSNRLVLGKHSGRHALADADARARHRSRAHRLQRGVPALQGAGRQEEGRLRRRPVRDRGRGQRRSRRATSW